MGEIFSGSSQFVRGDINLLVPRLWRLATTLACCGRDLESGEGKIFSLCSSGTTEDSALSGPWYHTAESHIIPSNRVYTTAKNR